MCLAAQGTLRHRLKCPRSTPEEGWPFAGIGAEISATIMEQAFDWLDAPVGRVTAVDVPLPYAANLEALALPKADNIITSAKAVCYRN